ncbi:transcriptional regulator ATRX [Aethina tumida]|uniref:transcriptional regulator ATRX n=1 Tax=Aethina tumida TaxID=116153 RepID=UPI0021495026|nr:transcriptional regulator ATRX [Aethina tumida]
MDEDDIYGDLPQFNLGDELDKLQNTNTELEERTKSLEVTVKQLNEDLKAVKAANEVLKTNISELYKTAKHEIDRKDKLIQELREQIDNFAFRRNEYGKKRTRGRDDSPYNKKPRTDDKESDSKFRDSRRERFDNRSDSSHQKHRYRRSKSRDRSSERRKNRQIHTNDQRSETKYPDNKPSNKDGFSEHDEKMKCPVSKIKKRENDVIILVSSSDNESQVNNDSNAIKGILSGDKQQHKIKKCKIVENLENKIERLTQPRIINVKLNSDLDSVSSDDQREKGNSHTNTTKKRQSRRLSELFDCDTTENSKSKRDTLPSQSHEVEVMDKKETITDRMLRELVEEKEKKLHIKNELTGRAELFKRKKDKLNKVTAKVLEKESGAKFKPNLTKVSYIDESNEYKSFKAPISGEKILKKNMSQETEVDEICPGSHMQSENQTNLNKSNQSKVKKKCSKRPKSRDTSETTNIEITEHNESVPKDESSKLFGDNLIATTKRRSKEKSIERVDDSKKKRKEDELVNLSANLEHRNKRKPKEENADSSNNPKSRDTPETTNIEVTNASSKHNESVPKDENSLNDNLMTKNKRKSKEKSIERVDDSKEKSKEDDLESLSANVKHRNKRKSKENSADRSNNPKSQDTSEPTSIDVTNANSKHKESTPKDESSKLFNDNLMTITKRKSKEKSIERVDDNKEKLKEVDLESLSANVKYRNKRKSKENSADRSNNPKSQDTSEPSNIDVTNVNSKHNQSTPQDESSKLLNDNLMTTNKRNSKEISIEKVDDGKNNLNEEELESLSVKRKIKRKSKESSAERSTKCQKFKECTSLESDLESINKKEFPEKTKESLKENEIRDSDNMPTDEKSANKRKSKERSVEKIHKFQKSEAGTQLTISDSGATPVENFEDKFKKFENTTKADKMKYPSKSKSKGNNVEKADKCQISKEDTESDNFKCDLKCATDDFQKSLDKSNKPENEESDMILGPVSEDWNVEPINTKMLLIETGEPENIENKDADLEVTNKGNLAEGFSTCQKSQEETRAVDPSTKKSQERTIKNLDKSRKTENKNDDESESLEADTKQIQKINTEMEKKSVFERKSQERSVKNSNSETQMPEKFKGKGTDMKQTQQRKTETSEKELILENLEVNVKPEGKSVETQNKKDAQERRSQERNVKNPDKSKKSENKNTDMEGEPVVLDSNEKQIESENLETSKKQTQKGKSEKPKEKTELQKLDVNVKTELKSIESKSKNTENVNSEEKSPEAETNRLENSLEYDKTPVNKRRSIERTIKSKRQKSEKLTTLDSQSNNAPPTNKTEELNKKSREMNDKNSNNTNSESVNARNSQEQSVDKKSENVNEEVVPGPITLACKEKSVDKLGQCQEIQIILESENFKSGESEKKSKLENVKPEHSTTLKIKKTESDVKNNSDSEKRNTRNEYHTPEKMLELNKTPVNKRRSIERSVKGKRKKSEKSTVQDKPISNEESTIGTEGESEKEIKSRGTEIREYKEANRISHETTQETDKQERNIMIPEIQITEFIDKNEEKLNEQCNKTEEESNISKKRKSKVGQAKISKTSKKDETLKSNEAVEIIEKVLPPLADAAVDLSETIKQARDEIKTKTDEPKLTKKQEEEKEKNNKNKNSDSKDTKSPPKTFENILNQSDMFPELQLTNDGQIPILELNEEHFKIVPHDEQDKNILNLIDAMNITNSTMECDIKKYKGAANPKVSPDSLNVTKDSVSFDNAENKVTSTPYIKKRMSTEITPNSTLSASSSDLTGGSVSTLKVKRRRRKVVMFIAD